MMQVTLTIDCVVFNCRLFYPDPHCVNGSFGLLSLNKQWPFLHCGDLNSTGRRLCRTRGWVWVKDQGHIGQYK